MWFNDAKRGNHFGIELVNRTEMKMLKIGKAAGKNEVICESIKNRGELAIESVWKLCTTTFDCGVVPELEYCCFVSF